MYEIKLDPVWWSIIISYALVFSATIVGRYYGDDWSTISTMVTRNARLLNWFAMAIFAMLVCQMYYVYMMIRRSKVALIKWPFTTSLIALGTIASIAGSLGFGIVSTNISESEHGRFAGAAFGGVTAYVTGFCILAKRPVAVVFLMCVYACILGFAIDGNPVYEYGLVTGLHAAALALVPEDAHPLLYTLEM